VPIDLGEIKADVNAAKRRDFTPMSLYRKDPKTRRKLMISNLGTLTMAFA